MIKSLLIVLVVSFSASFSAEINAGFWSSVLGGVVANSITGGNGGRAKTVNPAKQKTPEAKIQYALYGLGFYDGKFDGNLNTLESRKSIEALQNHYKIKAIGVLADQDRQQLLFINELYVILMDRTTTPEKRLEIYDEVDRVKLLIGDKK